MEIAIVVAFVVVAGGPLIGMWLGNAWAKAHDLRLRPAVGSKAQGQAA